MTPEKPREIVENKEKLGKEILDFKKLEISNHAKKRFFDRTGYDLEHQITFLKLRLSEAKVINNHPYKKVKNCLYLQDSFDKEIIYVVGKKKKTKKDVLITVRKPLKTKERKFKNFYRPYTNGGNEDR